MQDLKDQDVWDLNRARELWGKMNEKAMRVAGGRGSAIEILQAPFDVPLSSLEDQWKWDGIFEGLEDQWK